jgi:hypothetical protein
MTEIPIACTLDRAQMRRRGEDIRALGRAALMAVDRGDRQVVLRFRPDPEIHEQVKAIAAAESECCAFLDFTVARERGATVVTIAAPPDGAPVMHKLVDLFSADAGPAA